MAWRVDGQQENCHRSHSKVRNTDSLLADPKLVGTAASPATTTSSTKTAATLLRLLLLLGVPSFSEFFSQLARKQASKAKPSKASNEASMAIAAAIAIASTSY